MNTIKQSLPLFYFTIFLFQFSLNLNAANFDSLKVMNDGIHILSEKNDITIHGSTDVLIQFNKKVRYKIWNENGLNKIKTYSLPENHDPTFIRHAPLARNYQDLYSNIRINHFSVTKILSDKKQLPIELKESVEEVKMTVADRFRNFKRYNYELVEIQTGDIIEINYEYTIPFNDNIYSFLSYRFFLMECTLRKSLI